MSNLAGAVGQTKWSLDTPALIVDLPILERNIERMAAAFRKAGVNWRPHVKAHKTPAIAWKEIAAGAIGVTCAKVGEAEVMAAAGIRDILIANEIVAQQKIARVVNLLPHADIIVAVDNEANVEALDHAAREKGVRLRVVVEVDIGGNRSGVEPGEPVLALAKKVNACQALQFVGVMGWESHTVSIEDTAMKREAIVQAVGLLTSSADLCRQSGLPVSIVSCGGTGTYWITSELPGVTEIQAGGGVLCDIRYRQQMGVDHEFALTVLSTVTSRPASTRIVCDAGLKAMSSHIASPAPIGVSGVKSLALSAEHCVIELEEPNQQPAIGDRLEFIAGYSDTTVFLHDEIYGIRDGIVEVIWPILARGKLR